MIPPPSEATPRRKRPVLLALSLFLCWFMGLGGMMTGCGTLEFYRDNTHNTSLEGANKMDPQLRGLLEAQQKARIDALNQHQRRMVPLGAANVLLSGLLVLAAARAMSMRRNAHWLAQQTVFANIAFTIVDFVVSKPIREAIIRTTLEHPFDSQGLSGAQLANSFRWVYRTGLVVELVILGTAAWLLTRPNIVALYLPPKTPDQED